MFSNSWTGIVARRAIEPYNLQLMNNLYKTPLVARVLQIQAT